MFRNMIEKKEEGFTLIELLIVVAIIAILAAIAIPQFSKFKQRGYKAALTSDMKNSFTASQAYFSDYTAGTITDSAKLTAYGYKASTGVTVSSIDLNSDGTGNIELKHSSLVQLNSVRITGEGVVTYYN